MTGSESHRKLYFQYEVLRARLEIREYFLRTIVNEVYENIGQVLSLVKVQLSMADLEHGENEIINSSGKLIGSVIKDLRNICHHLKPEQQITNSKDFERVIEKEVKNFYPNAECFIEKSPAQGQERKDQTQLILFNALLDVLCVLKANKTRTLVSAVIRFSKDQVELTIDYNGTAIRLTECRQYKVRHGLSLYERLKLLGGFFELKNGRSSKRKIKLVISTRHNYGKNKGGISR